MFKHRTLIVAVLLSVVLGGWLFFKQEKAPEMVREVGKKIGIEQDKVMAYVEMTIPYLRTREYQSTVGEIKPYRDNATYTSYLTSYQSDGLKINALLTKPKGVMPEGGWPGVVFIHGYIPPTTYKTTEKYVEYVDYLARNGIVVFKIDLRGHGESEGEATGAYYSSDYVVDALNAYSALESLDYVKDGSVGLWGHSMAGNVTLRAMAARPNIKASVIWAGAVYTYEDMAKYRINDGSYRPPALTSERQRRREELFKTHGQFSVESPFWKQVVATNFLGDIKGALGVHHAKDDSVVNVGYTTDLESLLKSNGVVNEVYVYNSGGHNITGSSFSSAMKRTVDFYLKHLR